MLKRENSAYRVISGVKASIEILLELYILIIGVYINCFPVNFTDSYLENDKR